MSAATTEQRKKGTIPAFGIEADGPRNEDLIVQCIPGLRLRGAISAGKSSKNAKSGAERVNPDQAAGLGALPAVPGMQLHVDPAKLSYAVIDPINHDEEMKHILGLRFKEMGRFQDADNLRLPKDLTGNVRDVDLMKTLCREMVNAVRAGYARFCKGPVITLEDVDDMPGDYLLNPGAMTMTTQPKYEKDLEKFAQELNRG